MDKKFELVKEDFIETRMGKLYRIRALKDFSVEFLFSAKPTLFTIKRGDLGGYVSSESCLDQNDDSWISENVAVVNCIVSNNSFIKNRISDTSIIKNSIINKCYIETALSSDVIENSHITNSFILGMNEILNCTIDNCKVENSNLRATVMDHVYIKGEIETDKRFKSLPIIIKNMLFAGTFTIKKY